MQPIRFEPHHRAELLRLGLTDAAIGQIEVDALPVVKKWLRVAPRRNDVLNELLDVSQAMRDARSAIERLLDATEAVPHLMEARLNLEGGGHRHLLAGLTLDKASKSLSAAMDAVVFAIEDMRPDPVRHRTASANPIKHIYSAIQFSWTFTGLGALPPNLKPSSSPTSAFRRIVGICYEAIGAETSDPERAIKAYVKEWIELEEKLNAAGLGTERTQEI